MHRQYFNIFQSIFIILSENKSICLISPFPSSSVSACIFYSTSRLSEESRYLQDACIPCNTSSTTHSDVEAARLPHILQCSGFSNSHDISLGICIPAPSQEASCPSQQYPSSETRCQTISISQNPDSHS